MCIISIALVGGFFLATIFFIDKPFKLVNENKIFMILSQHYIDFGSILNSADSLNKNISSNEDLIEFNKESPKLSNYNYIYYKNENGERVFYNTHINANDCLIYEKRITKNKSLTLTDITKELNVEEYSLNNNRNSSCYINSLNGNRYIVFIYPFSFN